uniref:Uncharacterized protein n=1 Tax=Myoviridae sp. ctniE2 TaxID=2825172 RepID=A0A8S5PH16_9CAUD|nr:MAG TPA: hypothetical protein [Myoviridae sp. ctniE2]
MKSFSQIPLRWDFFYLFFFKNTAFLKFPCENEQKITLRR